MTGANQSMTVTSRDPFAFGVGAAPGRPGRSIALRKSETHVQWQLVGDMAWGNLVTLAEITGPALELRRTQDYIQWRVAGLEAWTDLAPLDLLRGEPGHLVQMRRAGSAIEWQHEGDDAWRSLVLLEDLRAPIPKLDAAPLEAGEPGSSVDLSFEPNAAGDGYILSGSIPRGANGLSAYQVWLTLGNTGTELDFLRNVLGTSVDAHMANAVRAGVLLVERQGRLNALNIAELRGDRMNMVDGIVDPYSDATDILQASNFALAGGFFAPTAAAAGVNVATTAGAVSGGDRNTSLSASSAFDANENTFWMPSQDGLSLQDAAWIGQDFGKAGMPPQDIRSIVLVMPVSSDSRGIPLSVQYSDNISGPWTTVANGTHNPERTAVIGVPYSGAHQFWRVIFRGNYTSANSAPRFSTIQMIGRPTPAASSTLRSAAFASDVMNPRTVRLAVHIMPAQDSDPVTANVDLVSSVSRDGGVTWTAIALETIEKLADGSILYEGLADIASQPAGSSMMYRHVTANAKDVRISGTIMQWKA